MKSGVSKTTTFLFLLFLVLSLSSAPDLYAQADPFYKGKTIRIVTGFVPGDVDDQWPRLIAQVMAKYIPGDPNFIVQNMAGAGSMVAANYIYSVAKPDGLTLGWISPGLYIGSWGKRRSSSIGLSSRGSALRFKPSIRCICARMRPIRR